MNSSDEAADSQAKAFPTAEAGMWELAQQYTGLVGYERGAKATSLRAGKPVIDCSGWVAFLLGAAMKAQNEAADGDIFDVPGFNVEDPWSDGIIADIEERTPLLLQGPDITAASLPRCATIGLNEGVFDWQANRSRPRGINHIAQIVRRPAGDLPFVSEAYSLEPAGISLTPLDAWLATKKAVIGSGNAWAVDPFLLASSRKK